MVLASYEPERKFIRGLTAEQTAKAIDDWIKSLDVGVYSPGSYDLIFKALNNGTYKDFKSEFEAKLER